jgi:hypothetical protein
VFHSSFAARRPARRAAALLVAALVPLAPACAETTAKDAQVIVKAIGFQAAKPGGDVKVAVVFAPDQPESVKDAEQAKAALEAAKTPTLTPVPVLVPATQLSALDQCQLVFVTAGTAAVRDAVFEAAKARKLLTVSTDAACAQGGKCVMAVKSEPRVEILVNRAAAQASSVEFTTAFRMMISEI